jgi:hypothetical protein
VPLVAGARDLRELWFRTSLLPTQRRAVVEAFGRFSRQVCEAGVFQDDFAPNNFLVVQGLTPQFLMIDFERARLRPATARGIRFMLAKIDREMAGASAADRMRFLRAFSGDRASKARAWWIRVRSFAPRLALRDLRRLGRTATRDGRRFRVLSQNGWSGWAHRGASDDLLARAREDLEVPGSTFALERWDDRWRVTYASVSRLEAARLWSLARWLHARRLGLEPRVLWWRDGLAGMVLETALPSIAVAEAKTHPDAPAALRVLLDRALALARIRGTLDGDAVVFVADPCGLRARFAAPHVLHLSGRGQENGAALSAALSSRLLG